MHLLSGAHDYQGTVHSRTPISLLNVDTKILSKALAMRLKKVIGTLMAAEQAAHVPGRFIGEPIRLISDILEYTDKMNIP